jgi:alpha-tubulin suppressor-like RCC1 family protein
LGLGDLQDYDTPINTGMRVKSIAAGKLHSLCVDLEGRLYVAGNNHFGQTGINNEKDDTIITFTRVPGIPRIKKVAAGDWFSTIITEYGYVMTAGTNSLG